MFSKDYDISVLDKDSQIPNFAPRDISLENCSAFLCDTQGVKVIEMRKKGQFLADHVSKTIFSSKSEMIDGAIAEYVDLAQQAAGYESTYLESESSIVFTKSGFGELRKRSTGNTVLIGVPIYNRFSLTKIFCEYVSTYLIPGLVWEGFDVQVILGGDKDDLQRLRNFASSRICAFECENNLGVKKNQIMEFARKADVAQLMWIDSDDFFHPKVCSQLIDLANENGYWSAIKPFCFFDSKSKEYREFGGYGGNHQLKDWGMGSGRVFTRRLIQTKDISFASANKGMDDSVKSVLSSLNIPSMNRLLECTQHLPIGVKTEQNIWRLEGYKTGHIPNLVWLPRDIQSQIHALESDAP